MGMFKWVTKLNRLNDIDDMELQVLLLQKALSRQQMMFEAFVNKMGHKIVINRTTPPSQNFKFEPK